MPLLPVLLQPRGQRAGGIPMPRYHVTTEEATAWGQAPNMMEVSISGCGRVPWAPCGGTPVLCCAKMWQLPDFVLWKE